MAGGIFFDELSHAWEEEGLFARDLAGQLIREVKKTEEDYAKLVTVTIDGRDIQVPAAVPTTDAQGNILYADAAGRTIPRATTILDAVRLMLEATSSEARRVATNSAEKKVEVHPPIPTLCHLDHLKPAGVCRICSVMIESREKPGPDGKKKPARRQEKLVPACVQPVADDMVVHTLESPENEKRDRIATSVRVLLELLTADHLAPKSVEHDPGKTAADDIASSASHGASDLERLLDRYGSRLGIDDERYRFRSRGARPIDESSPLIRFDANACILCDRCARSCADVKENFIISRIGKGYSAQIGFDLGLLLGESNCVECGECMLACPTTALTFRAPVESEWFQAQVKLPGRSAVTPAEMEENELLRTLPWRYRQWNQSSIVRWRVRAGDELCKLGDYGSTAFLLHAGQFGVWLPKRGESGTGLAPNWDQGPATFECGPEEVILGEMTILSLYPRNATVRARTDGEVFEVRRNVLHTLQRNPGARERLNAIYRHRALNGHVNQARLFAGLTAAERKRCLELLGRNELLETASSIASGGETRAHSERSENAGRRGVELIHVEPGQVIFRQGEPADCFYMIHIGHVKVSQTYGGQQRVLDYLRPDHSFGEIALLAELPALRDELPAAQRGRFGKRRTTTCAALDDVTLVRISDTVFYELLAEVPTLRERLLAQARGYLAELDREETSAPVRAASPALREFTEQGLFNAQRLLVLDLEACTRCDECTRACSDTHAGITRLIREGLRFDKWLVASSCRSCSDPYCLVGCPVDAIHRLDPHSTTRALTWAEHGRDPDARRLEIQIENNCIGCGLCASNCPYGNINMHGTERYDGREQRAVLEYRATTCDLCGDRVGNQWREVSCVYACPHDAAHRVKGEELLRLVDGRT